MDIFMVLEQFKTLTGLSASDAQAYLPSCAVAIASIMGRIKENVDIAANKQILVSAAASSAFYDYTLLNATKDTDVNFKAGDIRVIQNSKKCIEAAKALRDNAFDAIAHLLKDTDFSFEAVVC